VEFGVIPSNFSFRNSEELCGIQWQFRRRFKSQEVKNSGGILYRRNSVDTLAWQWSHQDWLLVLKLFCHQGK
jgi:hypothetical protein